VTPAVDELCGRDASQTREATGDFSRLQEAEAPSHELLGQVGRYGQQLAAAGAAAA
jgi:hypothetical protein